MKDEIFSDVSFGNGEYEVLDAQESLDEGIAIIYKHISDSIAQADKQNATFSVPKRIMVLDCGGGTTDMASCQYEFEKLPGSSEYRLRMETRFENGNSNFGGNQMTFRIFQLMKVKLAAYFGNANEPVTVASLLNISENDLLNEVDKCIENGSVLHIYDVLEQKSAESERILPTSYDSTKSPYAGSRLSCVLVKRNFYYLWQIAEKIKTEFFGRTENLTLDLSSLRDENIILELKDWYFYIQNPDSTIPPLKDTRKIPGLETIPPVKISTQELIALLKADIYYMLSSIFSTETEESLRKYDYIRLSGQSCRISLFRTLMKEFVPGRVLRRGELFDFSEENPERLKLDCVHGCITYIRDKEAHRISSFAKQTIQKIIYDVEISRGSGFDTHKLIEGIPVSSEGESAEERVVRPLFVDQYDASRGLIYIDVFRNTGIRKRESAYRIPICCDAYEKDRIGLNALAGRCLQNAFGTENDNMIVELIDRISTIAPDFERDKVLVFAVPNNDGYGFTLYQLLQRAQSDGNSIYYLTFNRSYTFEDSAETRSLFDGKDCEIVGDSAI